MEGNEFVKNMGTCKFCGQTRMVKTIGDITQSKADEIATNECNCKDAKVFQNRESKIKKAQEWVRLRFEHQPNIQEVFNVAVKAVANHDIEKTSIKEGDWTHNIFLDSDGYLNVKSSKKSGGRGRFLMSKRSRACDISQKVRQQVKERDRGCIFCHLGYRLPPEDEFTTCTGTFQIMHLVPRSQGGKGIPQNLAVGCLWHHNMLDNGNQGNRDEMIGLFEAYLRARYKDWDRKELIYNKWS